MAKKRNGMPHTLKKIFISPEPQYMDTAKILLKADKLMNKIDGGKNPFWWMKTFLLILLNMLRVPIIILMYFVYGWLLWEFVYIIF